MGEMNMYGLTPCPQCGSEYRWPTQDQKIRCDECGFVEYSKELPPFEPENYSGDENRS